MRMGDLWIVGEVGARYDADDLVFDDQKKAQEECDRLNKSGGDHHEFIAQSLIDALSGAIDDAVFNATCD